VRTWGKVSVPLLVDLPLYTSNPFGEVAHGETPQNVPAYLLIELSSSARSPK